jgi:hypothetical protein
MMVLAAPIPAIAQQSLDSLPATQKDSTVSQVVAGVPKDTAVAIVVKPKPDTSLQAFYRINPYVNTKAPLVLRVEESFHPKDNDVVFYILAGLLLALGITRLLFAKYFNDLFRIFFQTTFRQKSIREQLLQNKTASLFLNVFFCLSGGLFLYFIALNKEWVHSDGLVQKAGICVVLVAGVYIIKYIVLQIMGWLFGMSDTADTYLFIVFLINKVVGVLLLPATIVLALGSQAAQPVLLVLSLLFLGFIYLYRYIIALPLVRSHSGMTGFHFFVYLCAFEIVPVMVVYKFLLLALDK